MRGLILISLIVLAAPAFGKYQEQHFEDEDEATEVKSVFVEPVKPKKNLLEKIIMGNIDFLANVPKKIPPWVSIYKP